MIVELKCPYCFTWNRLSQYDYDMNDYHVCIECYNMFYVEPQVAQNV
jgi:hypothetical protein